MQRILVIVLCLFITACGSGGTSETSSGSSGGGGSAAAPSQVMKGNYQGRWNTTDQSGTANITIDSYGNISGFLINNTFGGTATIKNGTIFSDNKFEFTYRYANDISDGFASGTLTRSGNTVSLNGTNNIAGKVLTLGSMLIQTDAVINISNYNDYWHGYAGSTAGFYVTNVKLQQSGNSISGTYLNLTSNTTETITGNMNGSIITLNYKYGNNNYVFNGIVATGIKDSSLLNFGGSSIFNYSSTSFSSNSFNAVYLSLIKGS